MRRSSSRISAAILILVFGAAMSTAQTSRARHPESARSSTDGRRGLHGHGLECDRIAVPDPGDFFGDSHFCHDSLGNLRLCNGDHP